MAPTAKYYLVQMTPDLFRQERVNIGVVVEKGGRAAARFIGEKTPGGDIDGRKIRHLPYGDVYTQWVQYWKRTLATNPSPIDVLIKSSGVNYSVVHGGEVSDTDDDTADEVAGFLYPMLVTDGGLREALGLMDDSAFELALAKLRSEVEAAFDDFDLVDHGGLMSGRYRHPILKRPEIRGKKSQVPHHPSYSQQNGVLWVMETIDFTPLNKEAARNSAGFAAFMFEDIIEAKGYGNVKPVAIYRARPSDKTDHNVEYGMAMLKNIADMVNWLDTDARTEFVRTRVEIADLQPSA